MNSYFIHSPFSCIEYHALIPSTNDRVKELVEQSPDSFPCLIVAEEQSAGRGRENKIWWSGRGALLFSLGIYLPAKKLSRDNLPSLSVRTAETVTDVLKNYLPKKHLITLHHPNDVYADGKKICGILLESPAKEYGIIGVGLNVNNRLKNIPAKLQPELTERSITSMIELLGTETNIAELLAVLVKKMEKHFFESFHLKH